MRQDSRKGRWAHNAPKGNLAVGMMVVLGCLGGWVQAEEETQDQDAEERQTAAPVYRPPLRGVPGGRIGGGARPALEGLTDLYLTALVPEGHVGVTLQAQPVLYWYTSKPLGQPVIFTLNDSESYQPMAEVTLESPRQGGVQAIYLDDLGVTLAPDREYDWFVTVVIDPRQPASNVVVGGYLYRQHDPAFDRQLARLDGAERANAAASRGLWYDALEVLSRLVASQPHNPHWRRRRAALLEQGALEQVAAFDRAAAGN
ncbi:MAG: DUF928 domain-containing protein [Candidatus Competibacterales bacterium]